MTIVMKRLYFILITLFIFTSCHIPEIKKSIINKNIGSPVKILHISDLHLKKNKPIYDKVINKINTIKPDLLFITGDSIDKKRNLPLLDSFLKKIDPQIKKYAIAGNWEYWCRVNFSKLKDVYKKNGVRFLVNESDEVMIRDHCFYIYGLDDYIGGKPDITKIKIDPEKHIIVMSHCPVLFDHMAEDYKKTPMYVLSGHTHGGQITFFGKPLILPEGSSKYVKGIYKKDNMKLFVSKGIGNSIIDFRIGARPDMFYIIMK